MTPNIFESSPCNQIDWSIAKPNVEVSTALITFVENEID